MSGVILPDPLVPMDRPLQDAAVTGTMSGYNTGNWTLGNQAIYIPFVLTCDATLYAVHARSTSSTGNYDLGLYGPDFGEISRKGSTANAVATLTHTLPEVRVKAGYTYYIGLVFSSTTGFWRAITDDQAQMDMMGLAMEASALPLPATMTPVKNTTTQVPLVAIGIR